MIVQSIVKRESAGRPTIGRRAVAISIAAFALVWLTGVATSAFAVGFQKISVPDPVSEPLEVGIWYPSDDPASVHQLEPFSQTVAVDGKVSGMRLPLILISHGTGGAYFWHYDSALALAQSGFVVAAVSHTGDTFRDQSRASQVVDRPRHLHRVLDYMLDEWSGRDHLDPRSIGVFGFSAGGFTALVTIGGVPDMGLVGPFCATHPNDWACRRASERHIDLSNVPPPTAWIHDPRVKAAVIAAPARGFAFTTEGLAGVNVPIQLWRAEQDEILPHPDYAEAVYRALPVKPEYHVVPGAGHYSFLAPCPEPLASAAAEVCRDIDPNFDRAAFHDQFNTAIVNFFTTALARR